MSVLEKIEIGLLDGGATEKVSSSLIWESLDQSRVDLYYKFVSQIKTEFSLSEIDVDLIAPFWDVAL